MRFLPADISWDYAIIGGYVDVYTDIHKCLINPEKLQISNISSQCEHSFLHIFFLFFSHSYFSLVIWTFLAIVHILRSVVS